MVKILFLSYDGRREGMCLKEYFHVSNNLMENGTILQPNYGKVIQDPRYYNHLPNAEQYKKEMIFEQCRLDNFPDKPSRLNSIYLFSDIRLAIKYMQDKKIQYIYRVKFPSDTNIIEVDMNLIDKSPGKKKHEIYELALNYYKEVFETIENTEVLAEGNVIIDNKIKYDISF